MNHQISNFKVLFSEDDILKRIQILAKEINTYINNEETIIIANLKGSVLFFSDLFRCLHGPVKMDFIETQSYIGNKSSGHVKIIRDLSENVQDKKIVIVEDILDTGLTFEHILKHIRYFHNPRDVKICVLLDKPVNRQVSIVPDWVGFTVEDKFVIGYGLDNDQFLRNLPYIGYKD